MQYRHPLAEHWQSNFRSCMYILLFQLTRHFFTPPWLCHHNLSPPPMLMTSHSDWSMTGLRNLPGISHHSYTAGPGQLSEISKDKVTQPRSYLKRSLQQAQGPRVAVPRLSGCRPSWTWSWGREAWPPPCPGSSSPSSSGLSPRQSTWWQSCSCFKC